MAESVKMVHVECDEGSFEFHVTAFRPTKEVRVLISKKIYKMYYFLLF